MPSTTKITNVTWFDTCYVDYLQEGSNGDDLDGKEGKYHFIVGVERGGQTAKELIEQVTDEVYGQDDFPMGDSIRDSLKAQVTEAIVTVTPRLMHAKQFRLWPVDGNGNEITDEESDVPEEQPSAWFRVTLEWRPLRVSLRNMDNDDGLVTVDCEDGEGAANDQYIDGSTWESLEDGSAYTTLSDRPTLGADLEKQGYDVDQSEYSAPDDEDMWYWHALAEKDGSNYPDGAMLRKIMGWESLDDVRSCRRVSEQFWIVERAEVMKGYGPERCAAYVQACWDAGLPLDADRWLRDRK